MVKQIRASYFHNLKNAQYCALLSDIQDELPDFLNNGDEVYIIDTAKKYYYNASTGQLDEQPTMANIGGGVENQVLMKNGNDDYDFKWVTLTDLSGVEFTTDSNGILNVTASEI